ncbi:UNVERIFIED_CONTAM: hypothetical protein FKN15_012235 [Acipenser sinensis]
MGVNSLQNYHLSPNDYFYLNVRTRSDGSKIADLVLKNHLDREQQPAHELILTASDGGEPQRTGTAHILINVLDINDNMPIFDQLVYRVSIVENAPIGTLVTTLTATDRDTGLNGDITYSFSRHTTGEVRDMFSLNFTSGDITVKGEIDFEDSRIYEIYLEATDKGVNPSPGECTVLVQVIDENDNAPEITLISGPSKVHEDAILGTQVALVSVADRDSGANGQVQCYVPLHIPFKLISTQTNQYSLVIDSALDREKKTEYNVTVTAVDYGSPQLSSSDTILVEILDINDNSPAFVKHSYTGYLSENKLPRTSILTVLALDRNLNQNALVSYSILDSVIQGIPSSSCIAINAESGTIYALISFDYERLREFEITVQARDSGMPSLSTNINVKVCILDQNDNIPTILYPVSSNGPAVVEFLPRSANIGYFVSKVVAVDLDVGQNSWLTYHLVKSTNRGLFTVMAQTGEIRTARLVGKNDATLQKLVIFVSDHGLPQLSATATITVAILDDTSETLQSMNEEANDTDSNSDMTFYLIVSLGLVSLLFLISVLVLIISVYRRWQDYSSVYPRIINGLPIPMPPNAVLRCSKTRLTGTLSQTYFYEVYLSPDMAQGGFMFPRQSTDNCNINPKTGNAVQPYRQHQGHKDVINLPPGKGN